MGNHRCKAVAVAALIATSACSDLGTGWKYERTEDKLRDVTNVVATVESREKIDGYRTKLVIERKAGEPDFGYIRDQFLGDPCDPEHPYLMRLDDGPIEPIPCVRPELPLLASPYKRIPASTIRRMERADTVVVETPYAPGPIQYTFRVSGLRL